MKGLPIRSSSAPGASPTSITRPSGLPSAKARFLARELQGAAVEAGQDRLELLQRLRMARLLAGEARPPPRARWRRPWAGRGEGTRGEARLAFGREAALAWAGSGLRLREAVMRRLVERKIDPRLDMEVEQRLKSVAVGGEILHDPYVSIPGLWTTQARKEPNGSCKRSALRNQVEEGRALVASGVLRWRGGGAWSWRRHWPRSPRACRPPRRPGGRAR